MFDLASLTDADRVAIMEQAFSAADEVCSLLDAPEWELPTECPAWTVKDNLAHMAHYESVLARLPQPQARDVSHFTHIRNDFDRVNEIGVESRRPMAPHEILEEFRTATSARLKQMASADESTWSKTVSSPLGDLPARDGLLIRILDVFYHEQDIRRAVGRPGHLDGQVASLVFARMATGALPRVVAKAAQAPDGSVVVFDVGAPGETIAVQTRDGRGALVAPPASPTVRLRMDFETFRRMMGGRRSPGELIADGALRVEGDGQLAERVLDKVTVVP